MKIKTPTPEIYITSTYSATLPYLSGWVGTIDSAGIRTPEPNAYIYIYIDGFLLNPPSYEEKKDIYNNTLIVSSDKNGNWSTLDTDGKMSKIYVKPGSVLTVRAKSKNKLLSDLCVPYVIKGTPTPIGLGVVGDFDTFRAPNDGEYILYGKLSYWQIGNGLECNNKILIYNNGYKIGEVIPNKILGVDAVFPITENLTNATLPLLVDGIRVNIPLIGIKGESEISLNEYADGQRNQFTFTTPSVNASYRIYNNLRLSPSIDYSLFVDAVTRLVTIVFSTPPEPKDLVRVVVSTSPEIELNQGFFGEKNGINTIFTLPSPPNINTLQVYSNGLQLKLNKDYTLTEENKITFITPPYEDTKLLADYQTIYSNTIVMTNPTAIKVNATQYNLPLSNYSGNIFIFKNGLIQKEQKENNEEGTYTLTYETNKIVLTFASGKINNTDNLLVNYEYAPIYENHLSDYLNNTSEFKDYCLSASFYNNTTNLVSVENNIIVGNGSNITYDKPEYDFDIDIRLFKNGKRQKNGYDFIIDNNKLVFNTVNLNTDIVTAIVQNKNINVLIQDAFTTYNQNSRVDLRLTPIPSTVQVYKNGFRLNSFGLSPDYLLNQNIIAFSTPLVSTDVIVIDYQRLGSQPQYSFTTQFEEIPNGTNSVFTFNISASYGETQLVVFNNGEKLMENIDYFFVENYNNKIQFQENKVPRVGDKLIADFYLTEFNTTTNSNQLKIESTYPLELISEPNAEAMGVYRTLFGSSYRLDPGKDIDGEFLFYIKGDTGEWKYTNLDLVTRKVIPFNKGEHLSARAINTSLLFSD